MRSGTPAAIVRRWATGGFALVLSEHILNGVERAWNDSYYAARYTSDQARRTLAVLRAHAQFVLPDPSVSGVADETEDDLVLGTAVAAGIAHRVTGDKGLPRLQAYRGIAIPSPREFLTLLKRQTETETAKPSSSSPRPLGSARTRRLVMRAFAPLPKC